MAFKKKDIYPERKSPIEIELDKFFMDMRMIENTKWIKNIPNIEHIYDTPPPIEEYNKIFKDFSKLLKHSSWDYIDEKWNTETKICWEYQKDREKIQIDTQRLDTDSVYYNQLVTTISQHKNVLINIELANIENINPKISEKINRMYDGMNNLPYSSEHIVNAIKELLHIELLFHKLTDKIEVEFGESNNGTGYYTRSFIFEKDYQSLLREDILEYINPEYLSKNTNSEDIKRSVSKLTIDLGCDIRLISDYNKLVGLFAIRIIPFQIYLNRDTILFNPLKIKKFGRP